MNSNPVKALIPFVLTVALLIAFIIASSMTTLGRATLHNVAMATFNADDGVVQTVQADRLAQEVKLIGIDRVDLDRHRSFRFYVAQECPESGRFRGHFLITIYEIAGKATLPHEPMVAFGEIAYVPSADPASLPLKSVKDRNGLERTEEAICYPAKMGFGDRVVITGSGERIPLSTPAS